MKQGSFAATGVVRSAGSLPDTFLERQIVACGSQLEPLHLSHVLWELDLGGRRMLRMKQCCEQGLTAAGWQLRTAANWQGGWEGVFVDDCGEVVHLSMNNEAVAPCAMARSAERAAEILADIERIAKRVSTPRADSGRVRVRFWYLGAGGPSSYVRHVRCPRWSEIADNYPVNGDKLEWLTQQRLPYQRGHFVFWHGPSGTGKTSALRGLIREWSDMEAEVVTDPDAFLGTPEYLNHLLVEPTGKEQRGFRRTRRGRLIVLEDAPELLQAEDGLAARSTLAKLLNVSDGVLQHELRLVVLATTHEPCDVRPSALTRPGRCLQVLEFPRLDARQSQLWLANHGADASSPPRDSSLAELYARREAGAPAPYAPQRSMGFNARGS